MGRILPGDTLATPSSAQAFLGWGLVLLFFPVRSAEAIQYAAGPELKKPTLEELVETPVLSVSRVPESWFLAPSAIDVLTDDDVRRTGVVRLPEALRYVTGLELARFVGSSYAISAFGVRTPSMACSPPFRAIETHRILLARAQPFAAGQRLRKIGEDQRQVIKANV